MKSGVVICTYRTNRQFARNAYTPINFAICLLFRSVHDAAAVQRDGPDTTGAEV